MATIETISADGLLERVNDLESLIREHSAEGERERRLSTPVAEALRDAGFFRMFRPRSRGGLELDPVAEFRVAEAISRIDSAAGWNIQVSNASELFGAWFRDSASDDVFGAAESIVAGAFNPHLRAVPVQGGYRISGQTPFTSNCNSATWFLGLADVWDGDAIRLDEGGQPTTLITLSQADEGKIVENWNTLGMCGTGSHDVNFDGVFVPEERAVPFLPLETPSSAYDTPITAMAIWAAVGSQAAVALGIAQSAIDELTALGLKVPAYTENTLRDRPMVQMRLAQADGKLSAARAFLYSAYDEAWEAAQNDGALSMTQKARCQLAITHAAMTGAEVVDLVHSCVGASGIRNEQSFQRHFRDAHVVTQHAFLCESRLDSVGQIMFGMEPSWPFFQF